MTPPPSFTSSSSNSIASTLAGVGRQMTGSKAKISIHIDNHYAVKVYTSKSIVAGHVTIVNPGPKDLEFDRLQIMLQGYVKTSVDCSRGSQTVKRYFLDLHMPIAEDLYPVPRRYEADRTYTVPFSFVIPEKLVDGLCKHAYYDDNVQEQHSALPPSIGHWEKDDMAPDMARVAYALRARVSCEKDESGRGAATKKMVALLETSQRINVLPTFPEQPPLRLTKRDIKYVMSASKSMKKNILSPKSGELTVEATQPAAVMLSADGRTASTTHVKLDLCFRPSTTESPPPKILHVGAKVKVQTFFSLGGTGFMFNLGNWVKTHGLDGRGIYEAALSLPEMAVKDVEWKREVHPRSRRDSGYGSEECATSGPDTAGVARQATSPTPTSPFFYSTTLRVPVELPADCKAFLPTFHSCMASRVYILSLAMGVSPGGSNSTLTIKVKVPLQIGVEPAQQPAAEDVGPPSFETAVQAAAIEGPSVPNPAGLPGYSELR